MSKTLGAIVVIAVLVVGGYFAVKAKKPAEAPIVQNENEKVSEQSEQAGKKMAFSDFVKQGGSYKCEVKQAMSDFENSGIMYINGGNMNGSFSTVAEGKTMESNFIIKDGFIYSWSSAYPNMGVKMKTVLSTMQGKAGYVWNAEQIGDYNCEAWTADESKFVLPSSVTFTAVGPQ